MSEKVDQIMSELTEKVKLKVGCIGVGFAGSYNAQKLNEKLGIPAFVINSSVRDLNEGIISRDIPSFIIGADGRGAGNSREKSLALFKSNGRQLFENNASFLELLGKNDIIFVIFSSAGGTGSGTGPYVVKEARKRFPKATLIPIIISPRREDDPLCQYNNSECVHDVEKLGGPYMIGDLETFANDQLPDAYEKMSEWVIESVRKIGGMDFELSNAGMLDENDLLTLISEPGYLVQYTVNVTSKDLEKEDIQSLLLKKVSSSAAMVTQKDKNISLGGMVINLPNDINDPITTGNFSSINTQLGEPMHWYKNFSVSKNASGTVTMILSGLSFPVNRISESLTKAKEFAKTREKYQRNTDISQELAMLSTDGLFKLNTKKEVEEDDDDSFFD